jgi:hypothetical protein
MGPPSNGGGGEPEDELLPDDEDDVPPELELLLAPELPAPEDDELLPTDASSSSASRGSSVRHASTQATNAASDATASPAPRVVKKALIAPGVRSRSRP